MPAVSAPAFPAPLAPATAHPLTEAQSGLWYFQRLDPANPILNTGQYLELRGPLDPALFSRAVEAMAAEAGALALRFAETPDGPLQWVDPGYAPLAETVDLSAAPDPVAEALARMRADTDRPLDLHTDRLARFVLFILGEGHFYW